MEPSTYLTSVFNLSAKLALVTGGTSGLGASAARALASAGAHVVIAGRDAERGKKVAETIRSLGGMADVELVDVTNEPETLELAERCRAQYGRVDILVNSAGVFSMSPLAELAAEEWNRVISVNLTGTFFMCKAIAPLMVAARRGKIINLASTDGFLGVPEEVAYCASKGGVIQLTRSLGAELIKHGVYVNAIAPCDFETPLIAPFLEDPSFQEFVTSASPIARIGRPEELDGAFIFLASDASSMVVGHTLLVDGGRTIV